MANRAQANIHKSCEALASIADAEQVVLVSVRELLPLTGKPNLTCDARVRIANALEACGFAFAPKSALAKDGSGETVYVYGPNSNLAQVLNANEAPSLAGLEQLQKLESRLQVTALPKKISSNFVKRDRYHV